MKKKVYAIDGYYGSYTSNVRELTGYFEEDKLICFIDEAKGFTFKSDYFEHYFDTREEAKTYLESIRPSKEEFNKVFRWLRGSDDAEKADVMEMVTGKDEGYEEYFGLEKPEDVSPNCISFYCLEDLLANAYRGLVCINGTTFHVKEVSSIKRGGDVDEDEEPFEIELKSGIKIRPCKKKLLQDATVLKAAFGENTSGAYYPFPEDDNEK